MAALTWPGSRSTSRAALIEMTPTDQSGPNYSDLARLVLERARTAREGVALIGALIAEHGYSTYGGNSHLIADPDEGWVVIEFAGGKTRAGTGHGQCALAEGKLRGPRHDAAIDAGGKCDDAAFVGTKRGQELIADRIDWGHHECMKCA